MCIVYPLNECRLNVFPHILLCQKRTLSCFTQDVSLVFSKKFFHYFIIFQTQLAIQVLSGPNGNNLYGLSKLISFVASSGCLMELQL